MRRRRCIARVAAVGAVAMVAFGSACGPGDAVQAEAEPPSARTGSVPYMIAAGGPGGASFDDGLAFLNPAVFSEGDLDSAGAVFRADGTWVPLPAPPARMTSGRLGVSEDGGLVLALNDCDSCTKGVVRLYELDETGAAWAEAKGGVELDRPDAGMSTMPGVGATVFSTDIGNFTLVDGEVVPVPFTPDRSLGGGTVCTSDDVVFAVQYAAQNLDGPIVRGPIEGELSSAWVMPRSTWEWEPASLPPSDSVGGSVCTPTGAVFLGDGVEYEYSVAEDRWSVLETGKQMSVAGSSAIAADGTLYALLDTGTVATRTAPGVWVDTGVAAIGVYRLGDSVVAVELGASAPTAIPTT